MHEKTNNLGFRPGLTQTRLYSYRRWLEAWNFAFQEKRDCTIRVAKTKAPLFSPMQIVGFPMRPLSLLVFIC